jgi:hypothetical protein
MTLASIRTQMWRGGADVALFYKSNGRRRLPSTQQQVDNPFADGNAEPQTT